MRRLSPIAGIFFVFAIVFGCHRQADLSAYHGPPFTVQADAQRVTLETVVHSGGYGLNFDHAQVDDGRLNVYLTLDAPAMDELVMEAPQTLTKSFSNRARGADEVRVWVRITTSQQSDANAPYRVATQAIVESD